MLMMPSSRLLLLQLLTLVVSVCYAYLSTGQPPNSERRLGARTIVGNGVELRILPLGDSITYGYLSSDGNGYRLKLQQDLSGSNVNFVGSVRGQGSMTNDDNEGHPGATISQIAQFAQNSLFQRPNIVLLHAGTNDMNQSPPDSPYESAPDRLGALIDEVIAACPDATILVAKIIHASDSGVDARISTFNSEIPSVVAQRANAGHHIEVVDFTSITSNDLQDGLHPSDEGYMKMGDIWFSAIKDVAAKGWIQPPVGPAPSSNRKQQCLSGQFWVPANGGNPIASGVGKSGDAKFHPVWLSQGQIASGLGLNASGVVFHDIDGDGLDDYLWVNQTNGAVTAYLNRWVGLTPNWIPVNGGQPIATGAGSGVVFADLNGDSRADYLIVNSDTGAVQAWFNGGPQANGWLWEGPVTVASGVPGANKQTVLFGDINGDGRADYLVKSANGGLTLFLNSGSPGSNDVSWIPSGEIATGVGNPNITLRDINGDGRDDYLIWDQTGGLSGYVNTRGSTEAQPVWIDQGGPKSIASGLNISPDLIRLADINGDGKVDYCILNATSGAVTLYINSGTADSSVAGDSVAFADMDGDGRDDYVVIGENGELTCYLNGGSTSSANMDWLWLPQNNGNPIASGAGTRSQIHLADINGDSKADYLIVDTKTGAVTCYINGGADSAANGGWLWLPQGQIASGIGEGAGVRFQDIDGDGRSDYLWLSETGALTVYINKVGQIPVNWIPLNDGKPVASGVGARREEVLLADWNGDGRADYLWVHAIDGSVDVWTNEVGITDANWVSQGRVASGVGVSGANIRFAALEDSGRADYIAVTPASGAIAAWMNGCQNPAQSAGGSLVSNPPGTTPSNGPTPGATIPSQSPTQTPGTTPENRPSATPPPRPSPPTCTPFDLNPGLGINTAYCVCSGSTFAQSTSGANSCAFTTMPSATINPKATGHVTTINCQVCTQQENNNICSPIQGCTPTPAPPAPPPALPTCIEIDGGEQKNSVDTVDTMGVDSVKANGVEVCSHVGDHRGSLGSEDTPFHINCGNGWALEGSEFSNVVPNLTLITPESGSVTIRRDAINKTREDDDCFTIPEGSGDSEHLKCTTFFFSANTC